MNKTKFKIVEEIVEILYNTDPKYFFGLQVVLQSWGDTMDDKETLEHITSLREKMSKEWCQYKPTNPKK